MQHGVYLLFRNVNTNYITHQLDCEANRSRGYLNDECKTTIENIIGYIPMMIVIQAAGCHYTHSYNPLCKNNEFSSLKNSWCSFTALWYVGVHIPQSLYVFFIYYYLFIYIHSIPFRQVGTVLSHVHSCSIFMVIQQFDHCHFTHCNAA